MNVLSCVVFVNFMGCKNGKDLISKYSQLLEGLKYESQTKNNGRQRIGVRSLACSIIEG
jgi:hypothetical protein